MADVCPASQQQTAVAAARVSQPVEPAKTSSSFFGSMFGAVASVIVTVRVLRCCLLSLTCKKAPAPKPAPAPTTVSTASQPLPGAPRAAAASPTPPAATTPAAPALKTGGASKDKVAGEATKSSVRATGARAGPLRASSKPEVTAPKKKKLKKKLVRRRKRVPKKHAGMYVEALRGDAWVPAQLLRVVAPKVWSVQYADSGLQEEPVADDRLRLTETAALAAMQLVSAAIAECVSALSSVEQQTLGVRRQLDEVAERFDDNEAALRLRENRLQAERARVEAELESLTAFAPVIKTLEDQVTLLRQELDTMARSEEELRLEDEQLKARQAALEKEQKRKQEELKRKRRDEERLLKEKERERKAEEDRVKRERERQRQREEEEKRKAGAAKSKKAEQLKAVIEAEEAARQRELDAARLAEEEEEKRQQEEEAQLFATQQELLRAEEERKRRREADLAKSAAMREELLKAKREERKKGASADVKQEDLDSLLADEAELNELLSASSKNVDKVGVEAVVRESRVVREVNPDELDDSYLEDEERGLVAFLARRTEAGFVRASTAPPTAAPGPATTTSTPPPTASNADAPAATAPLLASAVPRALSPRGVAPPSSTLGGSSGRISAAKPKIPPPKV